MQLKLHWWPYTIPDCVNSAETKKKTNRRAGSRLSRMPLTRELKWCSRYVTRRPWWYPRIIWGASLDGASYVLSIPLLYKGCLEVLHLFRWSTHTPRCREAVLATEVPTMRWKWRRREMKMRWRWQWDESYLTRTQRGERKRRGKEKTPTHET